MSTLADLYHRDGFTIIPDLVPAAQVPALKTECRHLLATHQPTGSVFVGASAVSPLCHALGGDPRLVALLVQLLPGGVAFLSDKIVLKNASHRFATPWHQDAAYWPGTRTKLSVWIALDEVTAANGALRVLPGSHLHHPVHNHNPSGHVTTGEFHNALALGDNPPAARTVAVPAGAAVVFSDLLIHGSHPNHSGADRVSLISTYHEPVDTDEPFDLAFPARRDLVRMQEARS